MVEMVKFVTSLSSNELNASLQPFYKAAQAYSIDQSENKEKLQDAINKLVDAFIAGNFTVEDINEKYKSHMGISLSKSKDIEAKALPKLAPLKGDVPSRQEFIETNLQMQVSKQSLLSRHVSIRLDDSCAGLAHSAGARFCPNPPRKFRKKATQLDPSMRAWMRVVLNRNRSVGLRARKREQRSMRMSRRTFRWFWHRQHHG